MHTKRVIVAGGSIGILVLVCSVSVWVALSARNAPFIAPGAINVSIAQSWSDRVIIYDMSDPELGWNSTVARRLSLSGWNLSHNGYEWGTTEHYITAYQRSTTFWIVRLNERAELLGNKRSARIHVTSTWYWSTS